MTSSPQFMGSGDAYRSHRMGWNMWSSRFSEAQMALLGYRVQQTPDGGGKQPLMMASIVLNRCSDIRLGADCGKSEVCLRKLWCFYLDPWFSKAAGPEGPEGCRCPPWQGGPRVLGKYITHSFPKKQVCHQWTHGQEGLCSVCQMLSAQAECPLKESRDFHLVASG